MYPDAVDPTPTLTFSIRTLSPTAKGDWSLKPVLNPTVTFLVDISKDISLISTPLLLLIGIIVGVTLVSPFVFFLIVTSESPILKNKSTSLMCFPVNPSRTIKLGAIE